MKKKIPEEKEDGWKMICRNDNLSKGCCVIRITKSNWQSLNETVTNRDKIAKRTVKIKITVSIKQLVTQSELIEPVSPQAA